MDVDEGKDDLIGEAYFELANVMCKGRVGFELEIRKNGCFSGKVLIRFDKIANELNEFYIDFCASNVKNVEWFSKSDPFLRIYRPSDKYVTCNQPSTIPENQWVLVQETEYIKDNLNPDFKPFTITGAKLCKNCPEAWLRLEIWDNSKSGKHLKISTGYFTVFSMMTGKCPFIDTKDNSGKFAGKVILEKFQSYKIHSMLDLMNAGLSLSLYTAIDFTGSNGIATSPSSLHYMNPNGQLNQYESAIMSVASIL